MMHPRRQLITQAHAASSLMGDVLDGQAAAIHDLRVATRRMRELLPLAGDWPEWSRPQLRRTLRRSGRALGRVRQLDVDTDLLSSLERQIPTAAETLDLVRSHLAARRESNARRMVKQLQRLGLSRLLATMAVQPESRLSALWHGGGRWRAHLRRLLTRRGRDAARRIDRAAGLYFPNRLHAVRIGLKKLRYTLEAAHAAGVADHEHDLRELRKAQNVLGDLHDRHMLASLLEGDEVRSLGASADQLAVVRGVVLAEGHDRHQRYLEHRTAIRAICARPPGRRRSLTRRIVSVGAAATAGYAVRHALSRRPTSTPEPAHAPLRSVPGIAVSEVAG